jgi:hypothetical protein
MDTKDMIYPQVSQNMGSPVSEMCTNLQRMSVMDQIGEDEVFASHEQQHNRSVATV